MNYFADCKTPAEIKSRYRELALKHHPDRGGETAVMQAINAAYEAALKAADGYQEKTEAGYTWTYTYDAETERAVMDKIAEILAADLPPHVTIWLIGTWLWIDGTTREDVAARETLKALSCRWHSKRGLWYWRPENQRSRYSSKSLGHLAAQYGARAIVREREDDKKKKAGRKPALGAA